MSVSEIIVKNSKILGNLDEENRTCLFLHEYVKDYIETPEELTFLLDKLFKKLDLEYKGFIEENSEDKSSPEEILKDFYFRTDNTYDYLPKLYKLADFLLMSEKILNSIMIECFEYLYLSDKWNQDDFIPEILRIKIQELWSSFFEKYSLICRKIHEHTNEIERDDFFVKRDVYYDFGDVENIFGETHRKIAKMNSSYNKTQYVQNNKISFHFDEFLEILDEVIIKENRKCHSCIFLQHFELFNLEELEYYFNEVDDNRFKSLQLGHNQNTCQCEICIKTHINCDCKFHIDDFNHYRVKTLEEPDPDDYYVCSSYGCRE
jgi:hypothetical protein